MDQELKKILLENLEVSKDNNKILKDMRSSARWGSFFRFVYWIIILSVMFGTYYFIQPVLEGLLSSYNGLVSGMNNIQEVGSSLPSISDIGSIFDKLPKGQ